MSDSLMEEVVCTLEATARVAFRSSYTKVSPAQHIKAKESQKKEKRKKNSGTYTQIEERRERDKRRRDPK